NGAFDAEWPKSMLATRALGTWLASAGPRNGPPGGDLLEPLFEALADTSIAPDRALPDTGIGLDLERTLSPPFIRGERYGTRCSALLLAGDDAFLFAERRFGPGGRRLGTSEAFVPRARA